MAELAIGKTEVQVDKEPHAEAMEARKKDAAELSDIEGLETSNAEWESLDRSYMKLVEGPVEAIIGKKI